MSQPTPEHERTGLTRGQQQRGMRYTYAAASSLMVYVMLLQGAAIGALFIKAIGGTDFQAMLIGSMIQLVRWIQIPTSLHVPPRRAKPYMLRLMLLAGLVLGAAFLVPAVLPDGPGSAWVVLGLVFLGGLLHLSGGSFWMSMLHDFVPPDRRGRFFGKLRASWSTVSFLVILAAGWFFGRDPAVWQYQVVLCFGAVMLLVGRWLIGRMPAGRTFQGEREFGDWKQYVRGLFRQPELILFMGYYAVLGFCFGFLEQPLVLYMERRGFPTDDNILVFNCKMLGMILAFLACGSLVDRIGTKRVFLASHVLICGLCFAVVGVGWLPFEQARWLMPVALVLSGATFASSSLACTAQLFFLIPDHGRAFYLSLANIMTLSVRSLSPLLVGLLLDVVPADWSFGVGGATLDLFQLLLCLAGLVMLAAIVLLGLVRDVHLRRLGEKPIAEQAREPS